ncbi:hypothetical protein [Tahibacter amnicola]|uniref:Tetratricopeptide repeat protein n=1 Tax=Tahibacter amnicola TaxID=2976241 RepID=A0ABY6BGN3_9GAMM|nr:hypothetical protein [Tahibacter amnicola]UXI68473.1 hypothetical protein N4264_02130 [Tahibacter amnicola]
MSASLLNARCRLWSGLCLSVGVLLATTGSVTATAMDIAAGSVESADATDWEQLRCELQQRLSVDSRPVQQASSLYLRSISECPGTDPAEDEIALAILLAGTEPDDTNLQWIAARVLLRQRGADKRVIPFLQQLAEREPDNGAAWLILAEAAQRGGNAPVAAMAYERMAGSTRFDAHRVEWIRGVLAAASADPDHRAAYEALTDLRQAEVFLDSSVAMAGEPFYLLNVTCRNPTAEEVRKTCSGAARPLTRSNTVIDRIIGTGIQARMGSQTADEAEEHRTLRWQFKLLNTLSRADQKARNDEFLATGDEIASMKRALERAGKSLVPPPDWVPRQAQ